MARDPAEPASSGSASSFRVTRFRLVYRGCEIPLESGEYVIGRAAGSDVLVDDPLVSRRHARLLVNDTAALLEDLQSENGVFVNERRVRRSVRLSDGDRILVGMQEIAFVVGPDDERRSGTVEVAVPSPASLRGANRMGPFAPSTLEADAFDYLGQIADRMLRANRGPTAERLLRGHLDEVLAAARVSRTVGRDVLDAASANALRLATGLRKPSLVDFVIELHFECRLPPCSAVTTVLRSAVREVSGIDRSKWEALERTLASLAPSMSASDQALVRNFLWIEKA